MKQNNILRRKRCIFEEYDSATRSKVIFQQYTNPKHMVNVEKGAETRSKERRVQKPEPLAEAVHERHSNDVSAPFSTFTRCAATKEMHASGSSQKGQGVVEYLLVCLILLLCTYIVIEIVRFLSFKIVLQTAVSFRTNEIAEIHYDLLQKGIVKQNILIQNLKDKGFIDLYSSAIEEDINNLNTSKISYDEKKGKGGVLFIKKHSVKLTIHFVNEGNTEKAPGVYVKAQSCLPVLFSYFYKNQSRITVGKKVLQEDDNRNCLGQFTSSSASPIFWFSVRAAAYAPWPASTDIYQKGFPLPLEMKMMSQEEMEFIRKKWVYFPYKYLLEKIEK